MTYPNHNASDFIPRNPEAEVAAAASLIPADPTNDSTYAKAKAAMSEAARAAEYIAHGDADLAIQAVETTVLHLTEVLADYNIPISEVLPARPCAQCGVETADFRFDAAGTLRCLPCSFGEAHDSSAAAEAATVTTSGQCLRVARRTIDERGTEYGSARVMFGRIAQMWSAILGRTVETQEVALMMAAFKMCRLVERPLHQDSWVDLVAYSALGSEVASAAE